MKNICSVLVLALVVSTSSFAQQVRPAPTSRLYADLLKLNSTIQPDPVLGHVAVIQLHLNGRRAFFISGRLDLDPDRVAVELGEQRADPLHALFGGLDHEHVAAEQIDGAVLH